MEIIILPKAQEHLESWQKAGHKMILKRIALLVRSIAEIPFDGIGKP